MSSLSREPETKLTITRIKPRRKRLCQVCTKMATHKISYDHGFGVEHSFNFCEPHHAQEVVDVAVDNANVQAGCILF